MVFTVPKQAGPQQKSSIPSKKSLSANMNLTNPPSLSLIEAIKKNDIEEFHKILALKTDEFGKKFIDEFDIEQQGNPVYWAAIHGHAHFIPHLIKAGADVDLPANKGWTPVFAAAFHGHTEVIRALHTNANVNTPTNDGFTPVFIAALKGHASSITALRAAGANVNTPCHGETPIHVAAENGHLETIRALHAAGADVDTHDKDGRTPVFIAAQEGEALVITVLHAVGADVDMSDKEGRTPIFIAAQEGHTAAVTALLEAGADASARVISSWCRSTTALNTIKKGKSPKYREVIQVLEAHFAQHPDGIKPINPKTYCPYFSTTTLFNRSALEVQRMRFGINASI